jgi:phycocyanobilin lyase subunit beta
MSVTTATLETLLKEIDDASSSEALIEAVENLANARFPSAVPNLIAALGYNNPGAAIAAVDGLIQLGEVSVAPLLELLDNHNYGARAWAIRALAGIGDPRGLEILLDTAANDFALSVRRAAARGLGTIQWDKLTLDEQISGQNRCLEVLLNTAEDEEWVVRYAAIVGVQTLGMILTQMQPHLLPQVLDKLAQRLDQETILAVRARILLAQNYIRLHSLSDRRSNA